MDEGEKSLNASELRQAIDKADKGRRNFDSDDEFIAQKKQGVTGAWVTTVTISWVLFRLQIKEKEKGQAALS